MSIVQCNPQQLTDAFISKYEINDTLEVREQINSYVVYFLKANDILNSK